MKVETKKYEGMIEVGRNGIQYPVKFTLELNEYGKCVKWVETVDCGTPERLSFSDFMVAIANGTVKEIK